MSTIMLATDGSPSAAAATAEAIDLARKLALPLTVVSVAQDKTPMYGYYGYAEIVADLHAIQEERIKEIFETVTAQAEAADVPCRTVALRGLAGEEVCKYAREHEARLLVIGAHGWNSIGRLIHGSVSTYVLHHASTPVLVVHSDETAREAEEPAKAEAVS
jgi:nucleotide-binding universal stress UspA family protein